MNQPAGAQAGALTVASVGVVLVTFRGGDAALRTLDALARAKAAVTAGVPLTVVVVDNASGDGTIETVRHHAPWSEVIELDRNAGFAAACNVGIRRLLNRDILVLLNPDVEVRHDFFVHLLSLDWPPVVAARGPAIFTPCGELEQSARGFPGARTAFLGRTSLLARLRPDSGLLRRDLLANSGGGPCAVDWISGACLIAPSDRFTSIGLLDERYFMYWEDADWCWRARLQGYTVLYEPQLTAIHDQGSSSRGREIATTITFHRSALRYWQKNVARSRRSVALAACALTIRCALKVSACTFRRALSHRGGLARA